MYEGRVIYNLSPKQLGTGYLRNLPHGEIWKDRNLEAMASFVGERKNGQSIRGVIMSSSMQVIRMGLFRFYPERVCSILILLLSGKSRFERWGILSWCHCHCWTNSTQSSSPLVEFKNWNSQMFHHEFLKNSRQNNLPLECQISQNAYLASQKDDRQ